MNSKLPLPTGMVRYGIEDGLASDRVTSLLVDRRGFVWAGTSNGLSRFDGYEFRTYRADPMDSLGLNGSWIHQVSEDRSGRLWVATLPTGLCMFDPLTDEFGCHSLRLPEDSVKTAGFGIYRSAQDRQHDEVIWAATSRGVARLDLATSEVTRSRLPDSLADPGLYDTTVGNSNVMRCLRQDSSGFLWVGVRGSGLARFDPVSESFRSFPEVMEDLYPKDEPIVYDVLPSRSSPGTVWVSVKGGLKAVDVASGSVRSLEIPPVERGAWTLVYSSLEDSFGRVWFGTDGGLGRLSEDGKRLEQVLDMEPVRALTEDPSGQIWIGTGGDGLYRMAPDRIESVVKQNFDGGTRAFAEIDGLLLRGAWGRVSGLTRQRREVLQFDFPGVMPTQILVDLGGDLWVSTWDTGLLRISTTEPLSTLAARPAHSRAVLNVPDSLGRCLASGDLPPGISVHTHPLLTDVGTAAGEVAHFVKSEWAQVWDWLHELSLPRLKGVRVRPSAPDEVWLVHENGLSRIDRRTNSVEEVLPIEQVFRTGNLYDLAWDGDGRMWLAASLGLFVADVSGSSVSRFPLRSAHPLSPAEVDVHRIEADPFDSSTLWLGTREGLGRVDIDSARVNWVLRPGREHDRRDVVTMAFDAEGRVWTGTRYRETKAGLDASRYDPRSDSWLHIRHESALERLFVDSQGHVLLGDRPGFVEVIPEHLVQDTLPPVLRILHVASTAPRVRGVDDTPVRLPLWDGAEVRIARQERSLWIEYTGISYRDLEHVQYAYMLEGYDDDWISVGTERFARYTNLGPGDYTFRLRAANAEGVWTPEPLEVPIVVLPPWWRTGWAFTLYFLIVLAALVLAERLRHAAIVRRERRNAALREVEIRSEVAEEKAVQAAEHAERLEALNAAKSRLLANVSHEFRTPLTLILGVGEDARRGRFGRLPEAARQAHETILRNARRVDTLVRELLDLSRLEGGSLKLQTAPSDLHALVAGSVRAHAALAERKGVRLHLEGSSEIVRTVCDPEKVTTAVGNLVSNAVKFTNSGGEVLVRMSAKDGVARIEVRDTGIGIAHEDIPRVFERFEQVGPAAEGMGIGLALAKELVELHGGSVHAESWLGDGSTFTIELPIVDSDPDGIQQMEKQDRGAVTVSPAGVVSPPEALRTDGASAKRPVPGLVGPDLVTTGDGLAAAPLVLVVDDNDDVRAFLRDHFDPVFQVAEARDGQEGLDLARDLLPDLVIADVMMPNMDGIDLCRAIRDDSRLRTVPVVLLTARAGEESALEGLQAGADEYVTKPFSVALLVQLASNLVRSRKSVRKEAVRRQAVEDSGLGPESQDEWLRRRVTDVAGEHLGDLSFTLDALADEVGISLRQLERRLPEVCGESPSEMIRRLRFERACQLLQADVGTVREIARAAGYRSPSHFSGAFRRRYGVSPAKYRAEHFDS